MHQARDCWYRPPTRPAEHANSRTYLRESDEALKLAHGDRHRPAVPSLVSHRQVQLLQHPRRFEGQRRVAVRLGVSNVPLQELPDSDEETGARARVGDDKGRRPKGGITARSEDGKRGRRGGVTGLGIGVSDTHVLSTESQRVLGHRAKSTFTFNTFTAHLWPNNGRHFPAGRKRGNQLVRSDKSNKITSTTTTTAATATPPTTTTILLAPWSELGRPCT